MRKNQIRRGPSGPPNPSSSFTWAAGAVSAQSSTTQAFALPGVEVGDVVTVSHDPTAPGLIFTGQRVTGAGIVVVQCANCTVNPLDPGNLAIVVAVL